jgi:hypothetical protein
MTTPRKAGPRPAAKRAERSTTPKRKVSGSSHNGQATAPHSLRTAAVSAAAELRQLIGQTPESIVAVEKRDDGWCVQIEVVESHRIPETTDILAVYEVDVNGAGEVMSYRRMNRYVRGRIQE